jgi:hypothetical protein
MIDKKEITDLDREILRLARSGDIEGFIRAMMEHPVDGPLMRAFALEEDAPEYAETMERIRRRFCMCD